MLQKHNVLSGAFLAHLPGPEADLDLADVGLAPMFYGVTIDTLVTLTALVVIWFMGLM